MLASYAGRLAKLPGIARASGPVALAPGTWEITLASPADPISAAGQQAVMAVRALPAPVPVLAGGPAADFADQGATIAATLPLAIAILVIVTVLALWLMTGSVILPFKTLLMNALTAAAATGVLVFIFQDGRLTGPLAYTSQGGIEETDFLILAALAFALSTDYGVFLLVADQRSARAGRTRARRHHSRNAAYRQAHHRSGDPARGRHWGRSPPPSSYSSRKSASASPPRCSSTPSSSGRCSCRP